MRTVSKRLSFFSLGLDCGRCGVNVRAIVRFVGTICRGDFIGAMPPTPFNLDVLTVVAIAIVQDDVSSR